MKYVGEAGPAFSMPKAKRDMRSKREKANEPGPAEYFIPGEIETKVYESLKKIQKVQKHLLKKSGLLVGAQSINSMHLSLEKLDATHSTFGKAKNVSVNEKDPRKDILRSINSKSLLKMKTGKTSSPSKKTEKSPTEKSKLYCVYKF